MAAESVRGGPKPISGTPTPALQQSAKFISKSPQLLEAMRKPFSTQPHKIASASLTPIGEKSGMTTRIAHGVVSISSLMARAGKAKFVAKSAFSTKAPTSSKKHSFSIETGAPLFSKFLKDASFG